MQVSDSWDIAPFVFLLTVTSTLVHEMKACSVGVRLRLLAAVGRIRTRYTREQETDTSLQLQHGN